MPECRDHYRMMQQSADGVECLAVTHSRARFPFGPDTESATHGHDLRSEEGLRPAGMTSRKFMGHSGSNAVFLGE